MSKAALSVLSVFTDDQGRFGNRLGVVVDGARVLDESRQRLAYKLGFSETVFVEDAVSARLRLYTPALELPFAGHAVLGTAWLLDAGAKRLSSLRPPAGEVGIHFADGLTWLRGRPGWCPPWEHVQAQSARAVAEAVAAPEGLDAVQLWAFEDEARGVIRARVFASRFGVREDEACGSATLLLCARLERPLVVHHGDGSVIYARPAGGGMVAIGGRVSLVATQPLDVAEVAA